ncbi:DUF3068 domain-containing protein [Corynebacterium poyangense]|uniref:DUF3068 domain-containing protein n=1 Tax=Corynebacterium poyangense TaxID=2684405 RepID=A0A7H0SRK7_9CORY|nr:porin PorA family protein [Corynebacterium poyangense]QNQ91182.1 DUF3068 domain-containing protein [Corynebacterium poyangense]
MPGTTAQGASLRRRMFGDRRLRRTLLSLLITIILLFLIGSVGPRLLIFFTRPIPLDQDYSFSTTPVTGIVAGQPHSISSTLTVHTAAGSKSKYTQVSTQRTIEADGSPILQLEDQVDLIRSSAFPTPEPTSHTSLVLPTAGITLSSENFIREGLQYFMPSSTERRSFNYFDPLTQRPTPLDYVDKDQHAGLRAYLFQQDVEPVDLVESAIRSHTQPTKEGDVITEDQRPHLSQLDPQLQQDILKLSRTEVTSNLYHADELQHRGLSADSALTVHPYYTVDRKVWVEPRSGKIVDVSENVLIVLANSDDSAAQDAQAWRAGKTINPARVVFSAPLHWDEHTVSQQAQLAADRVHTLRILQWVAVLSTTAMVICGIAMVVVRVKGH